MFISNIYFLKKCLGAYIVAQWVVREDAIGQLYYQNIFSGEIRNKPPEEAIIIDPHSLDPTQKPLNEHQDMTSINNTSNHFIPHTDERSPSSPLSSHNQSQSDLFSSKELDQARSELIRYLETLTKVDESLGEILSTMPAALKRNSHF